MKSVSCTAQTVAQGNGNLAAKRVKSCQESRHGLGQYRDSDAPAPSLPQSRFRSNSALGGNGLGVATADGIDRLLQRATDYLPKDATRLINDAYYFADRSHDGQLRKSGEPYIAHPLEIALYLSELRLDEQTIAAALLHDVVEDCDVPLEELSGKFGPEIAKLVDGVTKLTRMDSRIHDPIGAMASATDDPDSLYAESLRKMLVAMAEDIRVVLIKLADRLHNMKTLDALPPEKQRRIAQETLDIYAPLAIASASGKSSGNWKTLPSATSISTSTGRFPGCWRPGAWSGKNMSRGCPSS